MGCTQSKSTDDEARPQPTKRPAATAGVQVTELSKGDAIAIVPQAASNNSKQQHDSCVPPPQQDANCEPAATCQPVTRSSSEHPTSVAATAGEAVVTAAAAEASASKSSIMVVWRDEQMQLPPDEQQRHDQLSSYNILDTEPEEAYDRITELCKTLFKVPIAMVTFVDKDRVWLKSVQGLTGLRQVERRVSLCAWTLLSRFPEALVVPDLWEDVRFKDSPVVVGWPHLRFYAAAPLVNAANSRLGTLCVMDVQPREFSAESASLLTQLSNMVMREVERKKAMNAALCNAALRHTSGDNIMHDRQGLMLLDMANPKWSIHLVNDAWQRVTGIGQEMAAGSHFWDLFEPPAPAQVQAYQLAVEQRRNFEIRVPCNVSGTSSLGFNHSLNQDLQSTPTSRDSNSGQLPQVWQSNFLGCTGWGGFGGDGGNSGSLLPPTASSSLNLQEAKRRSIAANMRYVRFQFRSVTSVACRMAPAISIPPALAADDHEHNYYWATADIPLSAASPIVTEESQVFGSHQHPWGDNATAAAAVAAAGGIGAGPGWAPAGNENLLTTSSLTRSSGGQGGVGSDAGSAVHAPMRTTFSLLPEDNPFQDITISSLLGWGSYGRVHRGYWNGSLVAVKVLEQVAGDFNPRSSLEPLLHHRMSHPNIVAMFDVCTQEVDVCEDGRPLQEVWMVLEFCNRGTLSDAIQRGGMLTVVDGQPQPGQVNMLRALTTAREVAGALDYLHSQNVLHGDLNGNNILLAGAAVCPERGDHRGFTAKVADFGLSRLLSPENEKIITRTHGTITHMAPEVITESTHSKAADVYSFGVVLFELLSSTKPYRGMHYAQIVSSITSGKLLQQLPQQAGHLPPGLVQMMASCLAFDPQERPTFSQLHQTLQDMEQQALKAAPVAPPVGCLLRQPDPAVTAPPGGKGHSGNGHSGVLPMSHAAVAAAVADACARPGGADRLGPAGLGALAGCDPCMEGILAASSLQQAAAALAAAPTAAPAVAGPV